MQLVSVVTFFQVAARAFPASSPALQEDTEKDGRRTAATLGSSLQIFQEGLFVLESIAGFPDSSGFLTFCTPSSYDRLFASIELNDGSV
jgi:hypothetical protein